MIFSDWSHGLEQARRVFVSLLVTGMVFTAPSAFADKQQNNGIVIIFASDELPQRVAQMRELIIAAAASGDWQEVLAVFESNELAPLIESGSATKSQPGDPIKFWKQKSVDGTGRDILASMVEVFDLPGARTADGDYIWPYLAALSLKQLTPDQQIDLFRLAGPKKATQMLRTNKYTHYRGMIGSDGTWHSFQLIQ